MLHEQPLPHPHLRAGSPRAVGRRAPGPHPRALLRGGPGRDREGVGAAGEDRRCERQGALPQALSAPDVERERVHEDAQADRDNVLQRPTRPHGDDLGVAFLREDVRAGREGGADEHGGLHRPQSGQGEDGPLAGRIRMVQLRCGGEG